MRYEERLEALEQKLHAAESHTVRLARQVTALRAVVVTCMVAGLALLGMRPATTQGIRVSKQTAPFQVVDSSGKLLLMVESGRPGPRLQLYDSSGRPSVVLGMGQRGGGTVTVYDRSAKPAVLVETGANGMAGKLSMKNAAGKVVFTKP